MHRRLYKVGEVIFREGDQSREVYRVVSGRVAVTIQDPDNGKLTLAELIEDDIFGEMAMIDESPRSATVTCIESCDLEIIDPVDFNVLFMSNPAVVAPHIACLIDRLRSSNEKIYDLNRRLSVLEKAASGTVPNEKPKSILVIGEGCVLEALNSASQRTIEKSKIYIKKFPFRIGRSGLHQESDILQRNDLSLINIDPGQVAKNHISIEKEDGEIRIRDRNTRRGTLVNGKRLHQELGDLVCSLTLGKNEIVLGDDNSNAAYSLTITKI